MQSPAIANRLGWFAKILNRQAARSIHFGVLWWFLLFIFIHVTLVFITGARQNLNYMFAGVNDNSWKGLLIFSLAMLVVVVAWCVASPFTIKHARLVQKAGQTLIGPLLATAEWGEPTTQYTEQEISPYFWLNGTLPKSDEFELLVESGFVNYRLRVSGLVENPREFSCAELMAIPKQEQITEHFCVRDGLASPNGAVFPCATFRNRKADSRRSLRGFLLVFEGAAGGGYYDVHKIHNMRHGLTILAYAMNGAPLSVLH